MSRLASRPALRSRDWRALVAAATLAFVGSTSCRRKAAPVERDPRPSTGVAVLPSSPIDASVDATTDAGVAPDAAAQPIVREEAQVIVDGDKEIWRLVWRTPPTLDCVDPGIWWACPCSRTTITTGARRSSSSRWLRVRAGTDMRSSSGSSERTTTFTCSSMTPPTPTRAHRPTTKSRSRHRIGIRPGSPSLARSRACLAATTAPRRRSSLRSRADQRASAQEDTRAGARERHHDKAKDLIRRGSGLPAGEPLTIKMCS
jgi:hypothetical protein